jgi:GDP-4-dehydro-6-deoxy-D-mannose reductase
MKKILITGFTGFVSRYFVELLSQNSSRYEVLGLSRTTSFTSSVNGLQVRVLKVDLGNAQLLEHILDEFRPDYVMHLASDSSVSYSWQNPVESFRNNTNIFLHLVESIRRLELKCRILSVGSSEEYGLVAPGHIPLTEEAPLNPISPYAVARVAQELLSKVYVQGYGMDIVLTRSFNHIGPGQKDTFVVSSFAKQIAKIKNKLASTIYVGDLSIIRDFLDVRDVVRAYLLLLEQGQSGEVYNICSGKGFSLEEILHKMMHIADVRFEYERNAALIRPSDNPIIIGSHAKIKAACGWEPLISMEASLHDIINQWSKEV